jgi:hypothetical protein
MASAMDDLAQAACLGIMRNSLAVVLVGMLSTGASPTKEARRQSGVCGVSLGPNSPQFDGCTCSYKLTHDQDRGCTVDYAGSGVFGNVDLIVSMKCSTRKAFCGETVLCDCSSQQRNPLDPRYLPTVAQVDAWPDPSKGDTSSSSSNGSQMRLDFERTRRVGLASLLIVGGCAGHTWTSRPRPQKIPLLHAACTNTDDCDRGADCVTWNDFANRIQHACELSCAFAGDCPGSLTCTLQSHGPNGVCELAARLRGASAGRVSRPARRQHARFGEPRRRLHFPAHVM